MRKASRSRSVPLRLFRNFICDSRITVQVQMAAKVAIDVTHTKTFACPRNPVFRPYGLGQRRLKAASPGRSSPAIHFGILSVVSGANRGSQNTHAPSRASSHPVPSRALGRHRLLPAQPAPSADSCERQKSVVSPCRTPCRRAGICRRPSSTRMA